MQAKAFVAARNHQIRRLREEVTKFSGFVSYLYRREREIQIQEHLDNEKHRLRAVLLIQAWWKGCLVRGFEAAHKAKEQRDQLRLMASAQPSSKHESASALATFFDNPSRTIQQVPDVGVEEKENSSSDESKARQDEPTPRYKLPLRRLSRTGGSEAEERVHQRPRQIHIYFSDTGGGHRASALSLEAALKKLYGNQVSVTLVDFIRHAMPWPLSQAPETYQTLGHFPSVYKRAWDYDQDSETWCDTTSYKMMWSYCRESVLNYLEQAALELDLIISVHPLIHHVVIEALEELARGSGSQPPASRQDLCLPVVTVVTDLGSAHLSWFDPRADMLFVPSQEIYQAAIKRGVPRRKIHLCGLPLREGFWCADPVSPDQKRQLQAQLGLRPTERPEVVLLMGGGEGFGRLLDVACAIGDTLIGLGYGQLVVVCGRNEEVRKALVERRWTPRGFGEWLFEPLILGFVTNVDQYMTAADCLVTKAGPGSIAESMIKGLPCLLTAFVPGQEEGNISYVTDNGAGAYVSDQDPHLVAAKIEEWLKDPPTLERMSENARRLAQPDAALEISRRMCDSLLDLGVELEEVRSGSFGTTWRNQLLHRKEQRRKSRQKSTGEAATSEESYYLQRSDIGSSLLCLELWRSGLWVMIFRLVLVALPLLVVRSAIPPCAIKGTAYKDPEVTKPNGGKPYDALACQMYCETNPDCTVFTYYKDSKDCWLLGTAVVDPTGNGDDVISGPEDCNHLLPGTAGKIEPNPLRQYPGVVVKSEEPAVSAREAAVSDSAVADSEPPSSGFPWAWLLGGCAVGAVLVGVYWCAAGEKRARGKTSRGTKVEADLEIPQSDQMPLVEPRGPLANPAQPAWIAAPPVPQYYSPQLQMPAPLHQPSYLSYPNQVY
ncbi:MGD1 [Symbiodinium microadriaticum]|nr:MGD1 [Symbiodinium microadriaticum]